MAFDWLIRGGTVIDGTGAPARAADAGLAGDRIAAIGPGLAAEARRVVDATGCLVAPGFIDMHAHSDFSLLSVPSAESKLRQGVTTEVTGMCGFSPAPASRGGGLLREWTAFLGPDLPWDWEGFGAWLDRLRGAGLSVNVAPFVGHGAVRIAAMGFERRAPRPEEARRMADLLRASLEAGAFGLSTGLIYPPSAFSETEELVALARVLAERPGRLYCSHIRGEGPTLERAVAEAIAIGERAAVPVQISHLKASGRANWPRLEAAIRLIDDARARGVAVTADMYPYTAGSTTLASLLPPWAHEGGAAALLARLAAPAARRRILDEGRTAEGEWRGPNGPTGWEAILIAGCAAVPEAEGRTVAELAAARGREAAEVMVDLLLEAKGRVSMIHFLMSEANVGRVLQHPPVMIGSDNLGLCAGPEATHRGKPHPRQHGCFARVLGTFVREGKRLSWEQAVHKMTGLSAAALGLRDRGVLRPGAAADVVVFEPGTVADLATYQDPHRYPAGIRWVWVNGEAVLEDGRFEARPGGRVLAP
ncbi:MAG: D-aminoacylase [Candidatus Rokubacteria bacterium]|nr:D-aminoacylase [Candidatus Rokubacteria bacterium]